MRTRNTGVPGPPGSDAPHDPETGPSCTLAVLETSSAESAAQLLAALSDRSGFACVVVADAAASGTSALAEFLAGHSPLPVREAAPGLAIEGHQAYVVTASRPLSVAKSVFTAEAIETLAGGLPFVDRFLAALEREGPSDAICVILRATAPRSARLPQGDRPYSALPVPGHSEGSEEERASSRHLGEALENIRIAAIALDKRGRLQDCNSCFLDLVGWQRGEALGQDWFEHFVPAEARNRARSRFNAYLCGHQGEADGKAETLTRRGRRREVMWRCTLVHDRAGHVEGAICFGDDITESRHDQGILRAQLRLREFAAAHGLQHLLVATLDEACALTKSPVGFYHFVGADQRTIELQAWSSRTTAEFCHAEGQGLHYDLDKAGIWADCIRERGAVIHNDYPGHPGRRGYPAGHADVVRELVVPVFRDQNVVAILGVGNKSDDYSEADLATVTKLADMAWDIVVAKRAEEALKRSEDKARQLFQAMAQGVVYQDASGRVVDCNPAAERILGLSLDQMLGRTSIDPRWRALREGGSDFPGNEHPAMLALRTGQPVSGVTMGVFHPAREEYRWIVIHAVPEYQPGGDEPYRVVTTFEDITERKQAEDALAESEARCRTLVANIPDAVYRCELAPPWRMQFMSEGVRGVTGYPAAAFLQPLDPLPWAKLILAEDLATVESAVADSIRARSSFDMEYRIVDAAGGLRWVHEIGRAVFDAGGAPVCLDGVIGDVTQRKRMEVALAQSEQRLRLFVDYAPAAIAMFDRDMRYLFASRRFLADYRLGATDIIGRSHYEVFPEIPPRWREIHGRCLRGETLSAEEDAFPRADGSVDWVHWEIRPWYLDGNRIGGIILLTEDITRRKRAEQALRESERRFRETLDNIDLIAIGLTREGKVDYCNDYGLQVLGYARGEIVGTDWFERFFSPEVSAMDRAVFDKTVREIEVRAHYENEILVHAGQKRLVRWTITLLRDLNGHVTGGICLGEDITERRTAEEALRRSEERFRAIANYTADWESWFDQEGRLAWVSPSVADFTGYSPEEMLERPNLFADLLAPDDRVVFERELHGALQGTRGTALELQCQRKNGSHFCLSLSWRPIFDQDGNSLGVRTSGRDVTYRKDAEAKIRQLNASLEQRVTERTAALTTALKELESFSYSASHDLRTPLRAIEGFGAVLEEEYGNLLDDQGRGYLQRIRNGAKRMAQLIDDLLDLARVSRRELRPRSLDLSGLARSVADSLMKSRLGTSPEIHIASGLRATADRALLRSVLAHLFENARKFSAGRPDARIEFGSETRDGEKVFFVRDNGAGFDMRFVDKLFRPFQRLHNPAEFEGNGIGLATVQRIVQRHGGRVWAEAALGQGATVYFTLGLSA